MKTKAIAIVTCCLASLIAGCTTSNNPQVPGVTADASSDGAAGMTGSEGGGGDAAMGDVGATDAAVADAAMGDVGATDAAPTATILDPTQSYGGETYAQWATAWLTWLLELPGPGFPTTDTTGSLCATDQPAAVDGSAAANNIFFLADQEPPGGVSVTRTCTIPGGQMIFFPMIDWLDDNAGVPAGSQQTDQQLRAFGSTIAAAVSALTLEIDGQSYGSTVSSFASYLTVSAPFSYTVPSTPGNFYATVFSSSFTGPVPDSFGGGYWILLAPLSAGSHTIHFTAQRDATADKVARFVDVTYDLTVQ